MTRFARTIRIEAPPEEIWAVLVDVEAWPTWASQFERIDRLDAGPIAFGSRVLVKPKKMPARTWKITNYEEGRSFTWGSPLSPGVRVIGGHSLTPAGDGTTAEFWLEAHGPIGTLLGPILRRSIFRENTRTATEGLKRHVEGRGQAS